MKKVSEVKEQIDRLGYDSTQRDRITDLLVACGVLERTIGSTFKVGDVWKTAYGLFFIENITGGSGYEKANGILFKEKADIIQNLGIFYTSNAWIRKYSREDE